MTGIVYTDEQKKFIDHPSEVFLEACPGSGKTRAIIGRVKRLSGNLPPRKGVAVLSFTNTAVDEFRKRCQNQDLQNVVSHPGFVGTFDSFVRHFFVLPTGIKDVGHKPTIVDSWRSLGIEVQLNGRNRFRGVGVSLDNFNALDGRIDPSSIGHAGLRAHVTAHKAEYERVASLYRMNLYRKGILSASDARVSALENLSDKEWSESMSTALTSRFIEIIVDEAQDCNSFDLEILDWLRSKGLLVTIVCDPDQAIYGFRRGNEDQDVFTEFSSKYHNDNKLSLTGNFRSSPVICSMASTLRDRKDSDAALGDNRAVETEIQILEYGGAIPGRIGEFFSRSALQVGAKLDKSFILSHKRISAQRASGDTDLSIKIGGSKVSVLLRALISFWYSTGSESERERALREVERILLQLMGNIDESEPVSIAVERNQIDARWLRRLALELTLSIPWQCEDTNDSRNSWLEALRGSVRKLDLVYGEGITINNFFRRPPNNNWSRLLTHTSRSGLRCATVHEAKGRQYDSVCFVIPPNRAPQNHTEQLFSVWEQSINDESKRVAYVAITRAQILVAIAVPKNYRERLTTILDNASVPWSLQDVD